MTSACLSVPNLEARESDADLPHRECVFGDVEGQGSGGVEGEAPLGDGGLRVADLEEKDGDLGGPARACLLW
jgi:hypothetical protein